MGEIGSLFLIHVRFPAAVSAEFPRFIINIFTDVQPRSNKYKGFFKFIMSFLKRILLFTFGNAVRAKEGPPGNTLDIIRSLIKSQVKVPYL